jgi:membrane-associated protease RseP (regulator of RpoE activity)
MEGPAGTIGALSILAAIVTVHECGHFLAARGQGIRVSKFSIGFGPALFTYQVGREAPVPPTCTSLG